MRIYIKHKNPVVTEDRGALVMEIFVLREKARAKRLLGEHCEKLVTTFADEKSSDGQLQEERDWLKRLVEIGR